MRLRLSLALIGLIPFEVTSLVRFHLQHGGHLRLQVPVKVLVLRFGAFLGKLFGGLQKPDSWVELLLVDQLDGVRLSLDLLQHFQRAHGHTVACSWSFENREIVDPGQYVMSSFEFVEGKSFLGRDV